MPAPKSKSSSGAGARGSAAGAVKKVSSTAKAANPLDLVMLTRDRIQETLDDFARRGRMTRRDANELLAELVRRGRVQSEDLLGELEHLVEHGRDQVESATRKARRADPIDRLVRGADRARRTVGAGVGASPSFPIHDYDELTAAQVARRLGDLSPAELRRVREYERRHGNRKTVLEAIEKAL